MPRVMKLNQYALLTPEKQEEHLNHFRVPYFSHSALSCFTRNQLEFEMRYIENIKSNEKSDGFIIGLAVHSALEVYFTNRENNWCEISLTQVCNDYIDDIDEGCFKFTKKWDGKTSEEIRSYCKEQCSKHISSFFYEDDGKKWFDENVKLVIGCEMKFFEFVRFNSMNYDVPIPLKMIIDLTFINKDDFLCNADHKTGKLNSTADCENNNRQQLTIYHSGTEASFENEEDKFMWDEIFKKYPKAKQGVKYSYIYESKASKNRDGSPQVKIHKIEIQEKLSFFQARTFDQMQGFFQAITNENHVYVMNDQDNMCNKIELNLFWIEKYSGSLAYQQAESEQVQKNVISLSKKLIENLKSNPKLLKTIDMETATPEEKIQQKLSILGCLSKVCHTIDSHSCITYLIEPKGTTTIKKIQSRKEDITLALGEDLIRVGGNLVKHEGNSYISFEVSKTPEERTFANIAKIEKSSDKIKLGVSTMGNQISWCIKDSPHLMIAGATNSGKSVVINSILKQYEGRIDIIDPKNEFRGHENSFQETEDIVLKLNMLIEEMDSLYSSGKKEKILIVIDEASDILTRTSKGLECKGLRTPKECLLLLVQKGRACGMSVVLASQRITAKLFDGDAKANFTSRLCLTTASSTDSQVMLDKGSGAENLTGKGDALYRDTIHREPVRIQCYS